VHDEIGADFPICCPGDIHWPGPGATHDWTLLTDAPVRPRPPLWSMTRPVTSASIRHDALARHVSQVVGYPPLCMSVLIPFFYTHWMEKTEEPFYEERWKPQSVSSRSSAESGRVDSPSHQTRARVDSRVGPGGV